MKTTLDRATFGGMLVFFVLMMLSQLEGKYGAVVFSFMLGFVLFGLWVLVGEE